MVIKSIAAYSQTDSLKIKIQEIINGKRAKVGVGIIDFRDNKAMSINSKARFPMQSVFKFHLGLTVLNQVDKGKLSLIKKIRINKEDLRPDTYSPMREKYPEGKIYLTIKELLTYAVSQSDNNACDILFKLVGGPKVVNDYIHSLGVTNVSIVATEAQMHKSWNVQYTNWSTPMAAAKLLQKFYKQQILSKNSKDELWKMMVETSTGATKIKGLLPKEVIVGHKSGWSGSNGRGLTGATNDIGIITLPDGNQFAIAIFVTNSLEDEATNDKMIAEIAKAAYDYFVLK